MKFKDTKYGDLTGQHYQGYIIVSNLGLTSLEGAPLSISGDFYCGNNKLTSLIGAPQIVEGNFSCGINQLYSLQGAPQQVGGGSSCSNNRLISLAGSPQQVGSYFYCRKNPLLNSLQYIPPIHPSQIDSDFSKEEVYNYMLEHHPEVVI